MIDHLTVMPVVQLTVGHQTPSQTVQSSTVFLIVNTVFEIHVAHLWRKEGESLLVVWDVFSIVGDYIVIRWGVSCRLCCRHSYHTYQSGNSRNGDGEASGRGITYLEESRRC